MKPNSQEYNKAKAMVAINFAPPIFPCKSCGYPAISGYCCDICGDSDPHGKLDKPCRICGRVDSNHHEDKRHAQAEVDELGKQLAENHAKLTGN